MVVAVLVEEVERRRDCTLPVEVKDHWVVEAGRSLTAFFASHRVVVCPEVDLGRTSMMGCAFADEVPAIPRRRNAVVVPPQVLANSGTCLAAPVVGQRRTSLRCSNQSRFHRP